MQASKQTTKNPTSSHSKPNVVSMENDPELKAYIYQNLIDLQPYLTPESQLAVVVDQDDENQASCEHALTLVATMGEYRLETEGQDEDIYEAFLSAKRKMLRQLEELYAASIDNGARENEIQAVIEGRYLIH